MAPLVKEEEDDRLRVPEVESLVPIFTLLRQAPARPLTDEFLYFEEVLEGRRRFEALARVNCAGLVSLLVPRLAPFLFLVDRQRKFWLLRRVKLDPSIPLELPEAVLDGHPALFAGLPVLIAMERREIVIVVRVPSAADAPASLVVARNHRPSISSPRFIAQPLKSSGLTVEAEAGGVAATSSSKNRSTIDTLM